MARAGDSFLPATEFAMPLENWAAFAAASAVLLVIPGPTILLVVSYALGQGWRTALPMAVGVALGDFTAMTLSMLGIGALLAASAMVFTALKWIGAAYLIYLGIKLFRAGGSLDAEPRTDRVSAVRMMAHAWLVTALNPKSITFFVAFLPQFLDRHADFWTQMLIFETTFLVLAFANAFGYALVAARARRLVGNPRAIRIFNRTGGTLLVGAGIATVAVRSGN
jgi:threonine/homoserine/homoserine lactone efflux protein